MKVDEILREDGYFKRFSCLEYEPLNGGYTNDTYKVKTENGIYVLRINGNQNVYLGLKREEELDSINAANIAGIAPKVFNTTNRKDYLITEFIDGHIVTKEEIHNYQIIELVADALVKIHALKGLSRECTPFHLVEKYLKGAKELKVNFPNGVKELLNRMEEIERLRSKMDYNKNKYCHNDYYAFNMIYHKNNITVIDWELSGYGDIFFDLATISFSNNFTEEEDRSLLRGYFKYFDDEQLILLHEMKYMNMLREMSWALLHCGLEVEKVNHNLDYYEFAVYVIDRLNQGYVTL